MQYQGYSRPGTQWVDSPSATAPPPPQAQPQQDMVFQWVDSPGYRPHPQHYLQAPMASPYGLQGADRHPLDPAMAFGQPHPGIPLDPAAAAAAQYQRRDHLAYGQRPPHVGDLYGQEGGYQLFDHSAARRGGGGSGGGVQSSRAPGAGAPRNQRAQAGPVGNNQGGRQGAQQGGRQGADARGGGAAGGGGSAGAGGSGANRPGEQSADAQMAGVLETLGTEGLKTTLTSALESLYEDRIKPMANYVKGRLKERSIPEPIVKGFVELYAAHTDLFKVELPLPGAQPDEVTVFFVTEPSWFKGWIDIDSADDPYDEKTWSELAKFLDGPGEHSFAGGRYGMARELMQRNLSFLSHLSLGEVCHMVQLAIQHRRLIVYHRKMLKPIQTVLCPGQNAAPASPGPTQEGEEIKDMDDLCTVLFRMLIHHPQGIRLCRMKQMIKHEFSRKLSEMAFQCTKLIELFNQEPLLSTFVLDTENEGKSIYVRLGKPETFPDNIKQLYTAAASAEAMRS